MLVPTLWLLGLVLLAMALAEDAVERLPLSSALIYLAVGWAAAAAGTRLAAVDPYELGPQVAPLAEWAVLVSLFAIGLTMRVPPTFAAWRAAARLASVTMVATIALGAVLAHVLLGLPWAGALLLAAVLAPTDPVLASEVRIRDAGDRDAVRLSLTAEGALNDASAFPAVMLALGLLGLHELGPWGARWLAVDVLWSLAGGVAVGLTVGRALGWALRAQLVRGRRIGCDELLYLGAIALTVATARLLHVSAFFAVFVAGVALFHQSVRASDAMRAAGADSADLSARLVAFGRRAERLAEVTMVLFIGASMTWVEWRWPLVAFALAMIALARPLAVYATLTGTALPRAQRRLVGWLGIRGVGSLFYLLYALEAGVEGRLARELVSATLAAIAASVLLHGVSTTPLMHRYQERRRRPRPRA